MLFNSYVFIFAFLPVVYLVWYFIQGRLGTHHAITFLALASLVFYGWSSLEFLAIFLFSFAVNALCIYGLSYRRLGSFRFYTAAFGVIFNLAILGYFKYENFFLHAFSGGTAQDFTLYKAALPIGISFYTFQQIAYVVDSYRRHVDGYSVVKHMLFIAFFPQLIAGPIVHHAEMMPQFDRDRPNRRLMNLAIGLGIFAVGLFKKTFIADGVSVWADPAFEQAAAGQVLTATEAWIGTLAYSFQLYFDFSAYSDMAIGLARMFGIVLPLNFNSPYKSRSIIEFWRRWHITLSRFLRDYVYIPLGGNRFGPSRRYGNILVVMALGGLWHGAGWTFVLWGVLHGSYIVINHGWHGVLRIAGLQGLAGRLWYGIAAWALTFVAVVSAWVPFRAPDIGTAISMLRSMYGLQVPAAEAAAGQGMTFRNGIYGLHGPEHTTLTDLVMNFRNGMAGLYEVLATALSKSVHPVTRFNRDIGYDMALPVLVICLVICLCLPNTAEMFQRYRPCLWPPGAAPERFAAVRLTPVWGLSLAVLMAVAILQLPRVSPFLYFQF
ncbi:MBOAT family O-acyltransferase [Marinibaculum pumilum]|uniref:Probable alginate O-acetylase AlgI n=1 Tax=Marinibaculum pumilum TaxID=1766165 RepID=A0ABV7L1G7_9PROT